MANLLLTNRCLRACPYCFAGRELEPGGRGTSVSWEDAVYVADFLFRSGEDRLALLGGEPMLHPEFVDLLLYFRARGLHLTVFTSGMGPAATLRALEAHLPAFDGDTLQFVCNLNDPEQTPPARGEPARVHRFLTAFGPWVMPAFTIYRPDFRLEFLFDLIGQHGLTRHLRLGVAHPVPGAPSRHVSPAQYREIAGRLCSYRPLFERFRVKPGFDCGFPMCQFTDAQLGWLQRLCGEAARFECGAAIDIAPDMSLYHCFPLSRFQRRSLYEFDTLADVNRFYDRLRDDLHAELPGIFEECDDCIQRREGSCAGGGACHLMSRMIGEASVRLPEIDRALADVGVPGRARTD
ncbi:MAG: radical SAM protein [Deltaproteobacteria bacterium]|nr:radical SAM protein [Deltaproteobacteria bacterium]